MLTKNDAIYALQSALNAFIKYDISETLDNIPLFLTVTTSKSYKELHTIFLNLVNKDLENIDEKELDSLIRDLRMQLNTIDSLARKGQILPRNAYIDDEEKFIEIFKELKKLLLSSFHDLFKPNNDIKLRESNILKEDVELYFLYKKELLKSYYPNIKIEKDYKFISKVDPMYRYLSTYTFKDTEIRDEDFFHQIGDLPLAKRLNGDLVNKNASKEMEVMLLDEMIRMVNQDRERQDVHTPTYEYMQYFDIVTNWGGMGNIFIPQKELINLMHKNGIRITGNIFMAPEVYGGYYKEMAKLTENKDGKYLVGRRLVDIARAYGFDGWFFNMETESTTAEEAVHMINLLRDMQKYDEEKYPEERKISPLQITWYDALTLKGGRHQLDLKKEYTWQGELNGVNKPFFDSKDGLGATSIFLNFGPHDVGDSDKVATECGRSPFSVFRGFDHEPYGPTKCNLELESSYDAYARKHEKGILDKKGNPRVSIGFYMASHIFNLDYRGSDHTIPPYPNNYFKYMERANYFFVGPSGNPRLESNNNLLKGIKKWTGLSALKNDLTVNYGTSFKTNFNTGNGLIFIKDEKNISIYPKTGFANLEMQEPMPSFRYIAEKIGDGIPLNPRIIHTDSYKGTACLNISGYSLKDTKTKITLYRTYLDVLENRSLNFYVKSKSKGLTFTPVLTLLNDKGEWFKETIKLDTKNIVNENKYLKLEFPLYKLIGKTITSIGFIIGNKETNFVELNIGEISLLENKEYTRGKIENIEILAIGQKENLFDIRLKFDKINNKDLLYYVYLKVGERLYYLKASHGNFIYIDRLPEIIREKDAKIIIKAEDINDLIVYEGEVKIW